MQKAKPSLRRIKKSEAAVSLRILLPIMTYPDATPVPPLARATDLAVTLGANLTALVHEVDIPPINSPVADFILDLKSEAAAAERQSRKHGQEIAEHLKHLCERIGLPLTTQSLRIQRPCGEFVAAIARSFDLTMLVYRPDSPDHALLAQDVLFGSGGPVVIFPAEDVPSHLETVAIAWDGSRAAARAVRDAIPVLAQARTVRVLTCPQDKPIRTVSIDGVIALLAAHAIEADHMETDLGDQSIGIALQAAALAQDAGLMVMGAYGHSRMREFIMGGATTSALQSPRLPLLMSH
jgi:nucleotide-binding universal stress UspA family protein